MIWKNPLSLLVSMLVLDSIRKKESELVYSLNNFRHLNTWDNIRIGAFDCLNLSFYFRISQMPEYTTKMLRYNAPLLQT